MNPQPVALHGSEVLVHRPHALQEYSLEGDYLRTLLELPEERLLLGVELSADGRRLAYVHTAAGELSPDTIADTALVVLDLESGDEIAELAQGDARLAEGFWGQLYDVMWAAGDQAVIVRGITHSDAPPPYAVVGLDGRVIVPTRDAEQQVGTEVEPQGRMVAVGFQYVGDGCSPQVDKEGREVSFPLTLIDLASGEVVAITELAQPPYAAWWSPDGTTLLFAHAECEEGEPAEAWYTWSAGSAEPQLVVDPIELWRDWHGDRAVVTVREDGTRHVPRVESGGEYVVVYRDDAVAFSVGDGPVIGEGGRSGGLRVLGFVD